MTSLLTTHIVSVDIGALLLEVFDGVFVRVSDDVRGSPGAVDDDAGDPLLQPVLHDPNRVLPAFQQKSYDWNVHSALCKQDKRQNIAC